MVRNLQGLSLTFCFRFVNVFHCFEKYFFYIPFVAIDFPGKNITAWYQ